MTDAYAPLSAALVRTLTDKLYEKRKAAALDIEKYFLVSVWLPDAKYSTFAPA